MPEREWSPSPTYSTSSSVEPASDNGTVGGSLYLLKLLKKPSKKLLKKPLKNYRK